MRTLVLFILLTHVLHAQQWQWAKNVAPGTQFIPYDNNKLVADFSGNFYVSLNDNYNSFLIKYDGNGQELWRVSLGGGKGPLKPVIKGIVSDGYCVYISGEFYNALTIGTQSFTSAGDQDIFIARLQANGSLNWCYTMGGKGEDKAGGLAFYILNSPQLGVLMTGSYADTAMFQGQKLICQCQSNLFIAGFVASGSMTYLKTGTCDVSQYSYATGVDLKVNSQGDLYCLGTYNYFKFDTMHFGGGGGSYDEYFLLKTNIQGKALAGVHLPNYAVMQWESMAIDPQDHILLAGYSHWTNGAQAIAACYDKDCKPAFNKLWNPSDCYGGGSHGWGIAPHGQGSYMVGNKYTSSNCTPVHYMTLTKLDYQGNEILFDTIETKYVASTRIVRDYLGDYIVSGFLYDSLKLDNHTVYESKGNLFIAKFKDAPSIVSVKKNLAENDFNIFPVPARDKIIIRYSVSGGRGSRLRIINSRGQLVHTEILTDPEKEIDISAFARGLYFFEVQDQGQALVRKVMMD